MGPEAVPDMQSAQLVDPSAEKVPEAQGAHATAPAVAEKVPPAHSLQSSALLVSE